MKLINITALTMSALLLTGCAATEPARESQETESVESVSTLNVLTDNQLIGDENSFIRIAPWDDTSIRNVKFDDFCENSYIIEDGSYLVMVYYHNSSETDAICDPVLTFGYPESIVMGESADLTAIFGYTDGDTSSVRGDELTLIAAEPVELEVVPTLYDLGLLCPIIQASQDLSDLEQLDTYDFAYDGTSARMVYLSGDIAPGDAGFIFIRLDARTTD